VTTATCAGRCQQSLRAPQARAAAWIEALVYSIQIIPFKKVKVAHTQNSSMCYFFSPYSVTERRVPELIPVLGSQPTGDVSHKPGGRLPLLFARPAVTHATLKRAATNFAAW